MRRKLSPEELKLWQAQMKDVKRLSKEKESQKAEESPLSLPSQTVPVNISSKVFPQEFTIKEIPGSFARQDLRWLNVDGHLDLHGMSLHDAYMILIDFIVQAQRRGLKVVLIITGKGSMSSDQTMRHQLPQWVREEPLSTMISSFHYPAKLKDGGAGAFYLRLRKGRGDF